MTIDEAAYRAAVKSYATRALQAAVNDDMPQAARLITELARDWGNEAPIHACLAWADTYISRVGLPENVGAVAFVDADTGRVDLGGDAPAPARWAVRWLMARRDEDEDTARALLAELESDREWGDAVIALLTMVALGLRDGAPPLSFADALLAVATQDGEEAR